MSPRKEHYATPEWVASSIKQKRKKLLHGNYNCPVCMKKNLKIQIKKNKKQVFAKCNCGFHDLLKYFPSFEPVDYYSKVIDKYRNNKQ